MRDPRVQRVQETCNRAMARLMDAEIAIDEVISALRAGDTEDGSPERAFRRALSDAKTAAFDVRQSIVEKSDDYYEVREP